MLPGLIGRPDDWAAFDRRRVHVVQVVSGDTLLIQSGNATGEIRVRLVGVAAPQGTEHWARESQQALARRLDGRDALLRLETTQTRSADGAVLAYVRLTDLDGVNLEMIRDGEAYVDPRVAHSLKNQFEQAESDARKKRRGLWKSLTDEQMPDWRQKWLAEQREAKRRRAATEPSGAR
jgi:endonuclease YncB( thermonuclease family)